MPTRVNYGPFNFMSTNTTAAQTTSSFTPPNNSLLVVCVTAVNRSATPAIGPNLTLSDSVNLTWTKRVQGTDAARWGAAGVIWTAPVTTGAPMTLTVDCGDIQVHDAIVWVFAFTNYNTASPVGGTANGASETGVGPFSMNLTSAPAASSEVLAFGALVLDFTGTFGPVAGTGWTQVGNNYVQPEWSAHHGQRRTGSTNQAVSWADMSGVDYATGGASAPWCFQAVAIEIKDASTTSGVTVTDVNTNESFRSDQTGVVVTSTGAGSLQGSGGITLRQNALVATQTITSWSATSQTFNAVPGNLKFGSATLRVTENAGAFGEIPVTLQPPTGQIYTNLTSVFSTASDRITAIPDLAAGDQLHVRAVGGGPAPAGLVLNPDCTYYFSSGSTPTAFEVRAWDAGDSTWGAFATQTLPGSVVVSGQIAVKQLVSAGSPAEGTSVTVGISNTRAGSVIHLLVVYFRYSGTTITSITDTQGNTYTPIAGEFVGTSGLNGRHYYAQNIVGGTGLNTITVTYSGITKYRQIIAKEIINVATTGALLGNSQKEQINPGTGTDAITSDPAIVGVQPNLISGWTMRQFGGGTVTAGTGFVDDGTYDPYPEGGSIVRGESKRTTNTASQAATYTTNVSDQQAITTFVATFKELSQSTLLVTDVDTDETITSTQSNVVVTGTGFGAVRGNGLVVIQQGTISIPQFVGLWSATSIQFNTVFDSGTVDIKHGAAAVQVTIDSGATSSIPIMIVPPSGQLYMDLTSVNSTYASRFAAIPDVATGDQVHARGVGGVAAPPGLTLNNDGTFYFSSGNPAAAFEIRIYDNSDKTWGNWATITTGQTITPPTSTWPSIPVFDLSSVALTSTSPAIDRAIADATIVRDYYSLSRVQDTPPDIGAIQYINPTTVLTPPPFVVEDTGLTAATPYYYRSRISLSDGSVSDWSDVKTATTAAINTVINPIIDRNSGKLEPTTGTYGTFNKNGFQLDGQEDYIRTTIMYTAEQVASFSVGIWFKTRDNRGRKVIGFENNPTGTSTAYDRMLYVGTDGRLYYGNWNGTERTISTAEPINDGTWYYAMGTYANNIMRLYVDGVKVAELGLTSPPAGFSGYWKIGGYNLVGWPMANVDGYLNGTVGPAHAYNRALTDSEVMANYLVKKSSFVSGSVTSIRLTPTTTRVTVEIDPGIDKLAIPRNHIVQRSTSRTGPWTTLPVSTSSIIQDSSLLPSTTYYYRAKIEDVNSNTNTEWSSVAQVTTATEIAPQGPQGPGPQGPQGPATLAAPTVSAAAVSSSSIRVVVTPPTSLPSPVSTYTIYRGNLTVAAPVQTIYQGSSNTFTDSGLAAGSTYSYRANYILSDGTTSLSSTEVSATTLGGFMVVGTNTNFLTYQFPVQTEEGTFNIRLQSGDLIIIGDEIRTISRIESETVLYVTEPFSSTNTGDKIYFKLNNEYQGSHADKIIRGERYNSQLPATRRWVPDSGEVYLGQITRSARTEDPVYSTAKGPFDTEKIYQQTLRNQQSHMMHLIKTYVANEPDGDPDRNDEVYWSEGTLPQIKPWLDQNASTKTTTSAFPTLLTAASYTPVTDATSLPGLPPPTYITPPPPTEAAAAVVVMSPTVIKAKATFSGAAPAITSENYKISSIVRDGLGVYTINFDSPFNSANYAVVGTCTTYGGLDPQAGAGVYIISQTASSVTITTVAAGEDNGNASFELGRKPFDPDRVSVIVAGTQ